MQPRPLARSQPLVDGGPGQRVGEPHQQLTAAEPVDQQPGRHRLVEQQDRIRRPGQPFGLPERALLAERARRPHQRAGPPSRAGKPVLDVHRVAPGRGQEPHGSASTSGACRSSASACSGELAGVRRAAGPARRPRAEGADVRASSPSSASLRPVSDSSGGVPEQPPQAVGQLVLGDRDDQHGPVCAGGAARSASACDRGEVGPPRVVGHQRHGFVGGGEHAQQPRAHVYGSPAGSSWSHCWAKPYRKELLRGSPLGGEHPELRPARPGPGRSCPRPADRRPGPAPGGPSGPARRMRRGRPVRGHVRRRRPSVQTRLSRKVGGRATGPDRPTRGRRVSRAVTSGSGRWSG